jgi:hypothetical protein
MAEDRNDQNTQRNAGTNVGDEGGQKQQAPSRNPNDDQSAAQHGGDRRQQGQGGSGQGDSGRHEGGPGDNR